MNATPGPIYSLLPAVFRTRDAALGGPLQALFTVLEDQYEIVKQNVWQLYNDQFIETCAPWAIPYIGQLIGFETVYLVPLAGPDSRAEVANTIGYRRRKGTRVALEQVTHDVSGRSTMAVEEFKRLVTTLSLRDVRANHMATADLRDGWMLEDQQGPFTRLNRTVDVRNITPRVRLPPSPDVAPFDIALHGPGRFNIPEVALWMWRLRTWKVLGAPAFALGKGGYFFSSLGAPVPLFQPAGDMPAPFARTTSEAVVPEPIRLRRFAAQLTSFYPASLQLIADKQPVPASQIVAANLAELPGGGVCTVPSGMIAIDPERGRIQYASDLTPPADLRVDYNYGAAAPIGGGPYDRSENVTPPGGPSTGGGAPFEAVVGSTAYPTLESAVAAWNTRSPNLGTILLPNFECYAINLTGANAIKLPAQSQLLIAAASLAANGAPEWRNACVTLRGDIEVIGAILKPDENGDTPPAGQLQINGIWLEGQVMLESGAGCVQIADCTLIPGVSLTAAGDPARPNAPSVTGSGLNSTMTACFSRVVSGPIALPSTCAVRICNSILDAGDPYDVAFAGPDPASPGPSLHIEDSTVIGWVSAQAIRLASNTIFWAKHVPLDPWKAPIWANRVQVGCVRFCWLPANAITPRQYECLSPDPTGPATLEPKFVSLRFGRPEYGLLSGDAPVAIWKGADNGSQIGAFYQIQETEAIANIQIRSQEYLPANLQCGVFLIPSRASPEAAPASGYGYGAYGHAPIGIGLELI